MYDYDDRVKIETLIGKTILSIKKHDDSIYFTTSDGSYNMLHQQDCCESVYIEDVVGDLEDLVGNPLLIASEDTNADEPKYFEFYDGEKNYDESHTWTFYNFATIKGHVTIRWYGSSNGYYSESVDIYFKPNQNQPNE